MESVARRIAPRIRTSEAGSERSTLHISGASETIPNCRAADTAWLKDNSGFYYTRYPKPGSMPKEEENYNRKVYFHRIGSNPEDDPLVYTKPRAKEDWPGLSLSPDDQWLVVAFFRGWSKSEVYLLDRKNNAWATVVEGVDAMFNATVIDDRLYVFTNDGAPKYRILTADPAHPGRDGWKELIPQGEASLEDFEIVGGKIVTRELLKATSRLRQFGLDGKLIGEIPLPTVGSITKIDGEPDGTTVAFDFSSFFVPPSVWRYDLAKGKSELVDAAAHNIDAERYEARQAWYPSKDGTPISMFLIHKKGLKLDGRNPTILDGYGGFAISITPFFGSGLNLWIENGGVMAMPNLRGGGEYGEDWHRAGMLAKKQNVFDDMIAAAEWLVREKITSPAHLAISGGSNGGLLMGAMITQRPDLFRAAICAVPLLDMVRYPRFLIARLWIPEYGDPEKEEDFRWLYAYSPYHHIKEGTAYPAILFMTADTDTRVDPCHARKMAARMQAAGSSRPILLRVEMKAGHGAGKPKSKQLEELTDEYSFLFRELGL